MIRKFLFLMLIVTFGFAKEDIIVFHAGSLSVPFFEIEKEFEIIYPQYDVKREVSGSLMAARKITELKRAADVIASADYQVIENLLMPKDAKFNALFATNELVIAYTKYSKYANIINNKNWTKIFLYDDVKIGHSNPNLDPCGYRAIFVVKLAEDFYNQKDFYKKTLGYKNRYEVGDENKSKVIVRPKETDLLGLLEARAFDYLFIYKSVAIQHNLKYINLPAEISLKDAKYSQNYKKAKFNIAGNEPNVYTTQVGEAMVYSITIPQNDKSPVNQKGAVKFVNFILSKKGQEIMKKNFQNPIAKPFIKGNFSILGKQ